MFRSGLRRGVLAAVLLAVTAVAGAASNAGPASHPRVAALLPSASPPPAPGHPGNPTPLATREFVIRGTAGEIVHVHLTEDLDFSTGGALVMEAHTSGAWGQLVVVPDPHDPRLVGAGARWLVMDPRVVCPTEPCENFTENVSVGQAPLPAGDYVFALLGPPGARLSFRLHDRYFPGRTTALTRLYSMPLRGREVLPVKAGSREVRAAQTEGLEPGGRYVTSTIGADTIQMGVVSLYAPIGGMAQWEYCFGAPHRPYFYTTGTTGSECDGDPATELGGEGIAAPTPKDAYGDAYAYTRVDRTEGTRGFTWDLVSCSSCHMRAWWADLVLDGWGSPTRLRAAAPLAVHAPAVPPATTLSTGSIRLAAGARGVVPVRLTMAAERRRVDVMTLLDRTASMQSQLPGITGQVAAALKDLQNKGIDIQSGLSLAGSSAMAYANSQPNDRTTDEPDATVDAANPSYRPPVLFTRPAAIGSIAATLAALSGVTPEQMPVEPVDGDCCHFNRQQGQLESIRQLLTGAGYSYSTAQGVFASVPAGLVAGWRSDPAVQRVLVDVTDQPFDRAGPITFTQPVIPPGDPATVIPGLVAQRVHHVGLAVGGRVDAVDALSVLSAETGTLIPAGGLSCGGADGRWRVPAGAPFVCTASSARRAIEAAVMHLNRPTRVVVSAGGSTVSRGGVLAVRTVDSYLPRTMSASLPVTCPISTTARELEVPVTATVRGVVAATGVARVTCDAAPAVVPAPRPAVVPPVAPAPAPAPVPAAAAPAAPPAAQPQLNPQQGPQEQQAPAAALGTAPQEQVAAQLAEQSTDEGAGIVLGAASLLGAAAVAVARRTRLAYSRNSR